MEQAMRQATATSIPTMDEIKASFQDRIANFVRVTYFTGMILMSAGGTISLFRDDLWVVIPIAVGLLLFIVGLGAALGFARGAGLSWTVVSLVLPANIFTLFAGAAVMFACLGVMALIGDKLGLSVRQWGQLGVFSWLFIYYLPDCGFCIGNDAAARPERPRRGNRI
jgi:TRAP-type C4-dicarboxylate transport system permease small subunit